jgi:hypothetical protein
VKHYFFGGAKLGGAKLCQGTASAVPYSRKYESALAAEVMFLEAGLTKSNQATDSWTPNKKIAIPAKSSSPQ